MIHENELLRYLRQTPLFADLKLPPPSNRGVIDPNSPLVWSHLDYLHVTFEYPRYSTQTETWLPPWPVQFLDYDYPTKGVAGYRRGMKLSPAGTMYWSDGDREKGSLLVLSGSDLALVRQHKNLTDEGILDFCHWGARRFTRLDFCTNIDRGHPSELLSQFDKGKCKTRIKKPRTVRGHGDDKGYTLYFGSWNSHKILRCYDKIAELNLDGGVWTRIELQLEKQASDNMAKAMRKAGVKMAGKQAIRDFVNAPELAWYAAAVDGDTVDLNLTPAKDTDFMRWLNEQVGPAIDKQITLGKFNSEIVTWLTNRMAIADTVGQP